MHVTIMQKSNFQNIEKHRPISFPFMLEYRPVSFLKIRVFLTLGSSNLLFDCVNRSPWPWLHIEDLPGLALLGVHFAVSGPFRFTKVHFLSFKRPVQPSKFSSSSYLWRSLFPSSLWTSNPTVYSILTLKKLFEIISSWIIFIKSWNINVTCNWRFGLLSKAFS